MATRTIYIFGRILNIVQKGGDNMLKEIITQATILFAIPIGFWIFHGPARVWERRTSFHISIAFKRNLVKKIFELPVSWHRNHHSGENIDKVNRASEAIFQFSGNIFEPLSTTNKLIGSYIALFLLIPYTGIIAIVTSVICIKVIFIYDKVLMKQYKQIYKLKNKTATVVHDYISNIITVISLRLHKIGERDVVNKMKNVYPIFNKNIIFNEWKWFSVSTIIALMVFITLTGYVYQTLSTGGVILVGTLYTLYAYLNKISDSFFNIAWQYSEAVERATAVYSAENILKDHSKLKHQKVFSLPSKWKIIHIKNLIFKHIDEKKNLHHVDNISLILNKGQKIAFVGSSGSGKSTIMSLIRGLHKPSKVKVSVDNKHLQHGLSHIYSETVLMPQEPEVFADTIKYNLSLGQKYKIKDLNKALQISLFKPVMNKLRKGIQTNIAEKGINLSGGEKQRLALARGILFSFKKQIILLDESTSSVDPSNEIKIFKRLFKEFKEKTIISSIHRLHLLHMFDYIYLIDNGKIIQQGTLNKLLKNKNSKFTKLWNEYFMTHKDILLNNKSHISHLKKKHKGRKIKEE